MKKLMVVAALVFASGLGCGGADVASAPSKLDLPIPPAGSSSGDAQPPASPPSSEPHAATPQLPARPPGIAEGFAESPDKQPIHYLSYGSGDAAVVFVHCWGCNLHYWDGAMRRLRHDYRVVALDLAGHGLSGKKRAKWTVEAFADDVRAVVDKLGLKKVVLVGHSMSGPVILEAALRMPDQVVGLVPVDTLHDVTETMPADKRKAFFAKFHADYVGATTHLVRALFPKTADPALVDWVLADELRGDPASRIAMLEQSWAHDDAAAMAKVKVPIVAVNADLYPTSIEKNRKFAPQFDAILVEGTGHWLMFEAPNRFEDALAKAIAEEHFAGH
jgi:pimeloyl-ACP methyl ester carboxylesterase